MIIQVLCFVLHVFEAIQALFSVFLCAVFMLPDILCLKKLLHHPLCLARHMEVGSVYTSDCKGHVDAKPRGLRGFHVHGVIVFDPHFTQSCKELC